MAGVVPDTHAIIWYLANDSRLSVRAGEALDAASAEGAPILVPSIRSCRTDYLVEKGRLPRSARNRLVGALNAIASPFELASLDSRVAAAVESISRGAVPDLPDRVIAATALAYRVPLVTRNARIRIANVQTIGEERRPHFTSSLSEVKRRRNSRGNAGRSR